MVEEELIAVVEVTQHLFLARNFRRTFQVLPTGILIPLHTFHVASDMEKRLFFSSTTLLIMSKQKSMSESSQEKATYFSSLQLLSATFQHQRPYVAMSKFLRESSL